MLLFDICIHCEITTIKLTHLSPHILAVCVSAMRTLEYTLSKFQVYKTVTIVTTLCIRSPELTNPVTEHLCHLANIYPLSLMPGPKPWKPLFCLLVV